MSASCQFIITPSADPHRFCRTLRWEQESRLCEILLESFSRPSNLEGAVGVEATAPPQDAATCGKLLAKIVDRSW